MKDKCSELLKYRIERELEHLAWLKRNIPGSQRLIAKSIARIKYLQTQED